MEMFQPALPSLAEFGPPQTLSQSDLGWMSALPVTGVTASIP